jgi:hypothetical protein
VGFFSSVASSHGYYSTLRGFFANRHTDVVVVTLQWPADILIIAVLYKRALESVQWRADTVMMQWRADMLIVLLR